MTRIEALSLARSMAGFPREGVEAALSSTAIGTAMLNIEPRPMFDLRSIE